MTLSINTNISALTAQQSMTSVNNAMGQSLQNLSTGLRINSAADDASGMAIADSLKAQALGLGQAISNANDAVSIVQTADGALEESINIVNTIKTKAIQAASDGQTAETRSAIQSDIDKLIEELDAIAKTTSYNGQQLLSGEFTNQSIQVGAYANETASINIASAESTQTGHISTAQLALENEDGGEVQLTLTSAITGQEVELETIEILANNSAENGMGALADEINSQTYQTGIAAVAIVETQTSDAVQAGSTGSDFAINGVTIGAINVENNDSDASLVSAINSNTNETGVVATMEPNGVMRLTSEDGRAIEVTGEIGDVFGSDTAEDMSTIGYVNLTQGGSSQFNIAGIASGGTGDAVTLTVDLETIEDASLAAGSTLAAGSELAMGTVVGGDAVVSVTVDNTRTDYDLEQGSTLAAGSTLSQGTITGGTVIVGGDTSTGGTELNEDMLVQAGSVLAADTVLGAGTVVTFNFTDAGTTYNTGDTLTTDVTLTENQIVKEDITLSDDSTIQAGSTLTAGSVMGADMEIGLVYGDSAATPQINAGVSLTTDILTNAVITDGAAAMDLTEGSVLADGSEIAIAAGAYSGPSLVTTDGVINDGDTIAVDTTYTLDGDQELSEALTTNVGSTIAAGSVLTEGTTIQVAIVATEYAEITEMSDATMTVDMTLDAGSSLAAGSTLMAGSELGDDTFVKGESGDLTTYAETELAAGSTLGDSSELAEGSSVGGAITIAAVTDLDNDMTLEAGSSLTEGTMLEAGTMVNQDMTLAQTSAAGAAVELQAGDVLTEDLFVQTGGTITLSEEMTLNSGSALGADSEIIINTESSGNLKLSNEMSMTLSDLSVMTQEDAQIAISLADAALKDLDQTRAGLGSVQNQLTSTIANLSVTKTNVLASESTIRDVDFAEETSNFAKLQMLSQTSTYALSQANAASQNLLSLLQ